ncbi:MAG: glycosyltransferase [Salinivenus sp.]
MPLDSALSLLIGGLALVHLSTWGILLANLVYLRRSPSGPPSEQPSLSVCIPARNEAENLQRLLPSLLQQSYPNLEIHVWDDGSDDDTWHVLQSVEDDRLHRHRGTGPPTGWLGKVHALYQCAQRATGERYLFLDADAALVDPDALQRLMDRHEARDERVTTGLPHLRGGASLLVSLVPYAMLTGLPWPLVRHTALPSLSALNGQCWIIDAELYHAHEPHRAVKNNILEDVAIGRYLKEKGHPPALLDAQRDVAVYMYRDFGEAWRGFRKNAYLLLGGRPSSFTAMWTGFLLVWIVSPLLSPWFLASLYGLKAVTDRINGVASGVTLLAPVSFVLGIVLQLDSALHHWFNRVTWKGRTVSSTPTESVEH